jgi:putative ABC transport system permease protein
MLRIALLMLFRDKAKYAMLISGLTFCSLLMSQQAGVFCGIMMWTTATLRNISSPVWVVDAKVQQVNEVIPLRDIDVQRVRSLPGVAWAVPLFWGIVQARLPDGSFQSAQLTGLDSSSFTGRPAVMLEGRIEDLRMPNSVIIDQVGVEKFRRKGIDARGVNITDASQIAPALREGLASAVPFLISIPVDYSKNIDLMEQVHGSALN